jgi:hypothetical protein
MGCWNSKAFKKYIQDSCNWLLKNDLVMGAFKGK